MWADTCQVPAVAEEALKSLESERLGRVKEEKNWLCQSGELGKDGSTVPWWKGYSFLGLLSPWAEPLARYSFLSTAALACSPSLLLYILDFFLRKTQPSSLFLLQ